MNHFILWLLVFISLDSFAEENLEGKFYVLCATEGSSSLEHRWRFLKDGVAFQTGIFRGSNQESPCKGPALFAVGRVYKYEVRGTDLLATLTKSRVIALSKRVIGHFNQNKFCEKDNWVVDEFVECSGKDIFFNLEEREGYQKVFKFKMNKEYLETINKDGAVLKFTPKLRE